MSRNLIAVMSPGLARAYRPMLRASGFTRLLLKAGIVALVANEIRGFVLAVPILYGIYLEGGRWTALWIGFCSLAGIAISVIVPLLIARKFRLRPIRAA